MRPDQNPIRLKGLDHQAILRGVGIHDEVADLNNKSSQVKSCQIQDMRSIKLSNQVRSSQVNKCESGQVSQVKSSEVKSVKSGRVRTTTYQIK